MQKVGMEALKATFEAVSYAAQLANKIGTDVTAITIVLKEMPMNLVIMAQLRS